MAGARVLSSKEKEKKKHAITQRAVCTYMCEKVESDREAGICCENHKIRSELISFYSLPPPQIPPVFLPFLPVNLHDYERA